MRRLVEPLLPGPKRTGRPLRWPLREIFNAIFYVMRGAAWRDKGSFAMEPGRCSPPRAARSRSSSRSSPIERGAPVGDVDLFEWRVDCRRETRIDDLVFAHVVLLRPADHASFQGRGLRTPVAGSPRIDVSAQGPLTRRHRAQRARNSCVSLATSSARSSSAKWPASKTWTSAPGTSRR